MDYNAANRPANGSGSIYNHQQLRPVPPTPPPPVLVHHHPAPPGPALDPNLYQFLPPAYAALLAAQHQQYVQQVGSAGPASAYPVASTSSSAIVHHHHHPEDGSFSTGEETSNQAFTAEDMPSLDNQFSTVSQIEATPHIDPETGEAVFPCPFCEKSYGGKHGRSIWRRHLSNKHGIPLHIQPRKTRWDNGRPCLHVLQVPLILTGMSAPQSDTNRPKDEAERHKRTLESKRRWAAKNRQDKKGKNLPEADAVRRSQSKRRDMSDSREGSFAPIDRNGDANDAQDGHDEVSRGTRFEDTDQAFMAHANAVAAQQQQTEQNQQSQQTISVERTHAQASAGLFYNTPIPPRCEQLLHLSLPPQASGQSRAVQHPQQLLQGAMLDRASAPRTIEHQILPTVSIPPHMQQPPSPQPLQMVQQERARSSSRQPLPPTLHQFESERRQQGQRISNNLLAAPPMLQRSQSAPIAVPINANPDQSFAQYAHAIIPGQDSQAVPNFVSQAPRMPETSLSVQHAVRAGTGLAASPHMYRSNSTGELVPQAQTLSHPHLQSYRLDVGHHRANLPMMPSRPEASRTKSSLEAIADAQRRPSTVVAVPHASVAAVPTVEPSLQPVGTMHPLPPPPPQAVVGKRKRQREASAKPAESKARLAKAKSSEAVTEAKCAPKKVSLKKADSKAEAAMQLLALKTSSSSPPPSPDRTNAEDAGPSFLAGEISFADSGYGPVIDDDEEDEPVQPVKRKRQVGTAIARPMEKPAPAALAGVAEAQMDLPSSPIGFALSSAPSSPPMPEQSLPKPAAVAYEKRTPLRQPRKKRSRQAVAEDEIDENEGYGRAERISLESSPPEAAMADASVPRKRLLTSSPVSRHSQVTSAMGVMASHYPQSGTPAWALNPATVAAPAGKAINIFNTGAGNAGRPSAGLRMSNLPSSPSFAGFTFSSPEHAAVSRSLGLVPESQLQTMPAFDYGFGFLRGLGDSSIMQEYAQGVFGGPLPDSEK